MSRSAGGALVAVLLVLGVSVHLGETWREGASTYVPVHDPSPERRPWWWSIGDGDQRWTVWVLARNARALLSEPGRVFQAEGCHPADSALAYGHPVLAHALMMTPVYAATGDPVLTYNVLLGLAVVVSGLAMYLLVSEWTGNPVAAVVSALLFALQAERMRRVAHPFIYDTTWLVLALFFARRLFEHGRWRDSLGLAVSCSLQIANSFYPLVGSVFFAVPVGAWLVYQYPLRRAAAPLLFALACIGGAAWFVFGPYLAVARAGDVLHAAGGFQIYYPWSFFLPGGACSLGWLAAVLVACSLLLGRPRSGWAIPGDPRLALVGAVLLVLLLATGGNVVARAGAAKEGGVIALPNLYAWLAQWLPGLDSVRSPALTFPAANTALAILAGMGAARVLDRFGDRRGFLGGLLIAIAFFAVVRPRVAYEPMRMRPAESALEFFDRLEARGSQGPLLELPIRTRNARFSYGPATEWLLLSAYHHRRTSACFNSYTPPLLERVAELGDRLPEATAAEELSRMGFQTVVIHTHDVGRPRLRALASASSLHEVLRDDERIAYELGSP